MTPRLTTWTGQPLDLRVEVSLLTQIRRGRELVEQLEHIMRRLQAALPATVEFTERWVEIEDALRACKADAIRLSDAAQVYVLQQALQDRTHAAR